MRRRPDRFLLSVSVRAQVRWHICTHLHCDSLFQYRDKKGFQSHTHFAFEQATEWQLLAFILDGDVAAASDRVSHHVILDAMIIVGPLIFSVAWLRRGRRRFGKLDDIMAPRTSTQLTRICEVVRRGGLQLAAENHDVPSSASALRTSNWRRRVESQLLHGNAAACTRGRTLSCNPLVQRCYRVDPGSGRFASAVLAAAADDCAGEPI